VLFCNLFKIPVLRIWINYKNYPVSNKILRVVQNKLYNSLVFNLYKAYNTLPVPQLHMQQIVLFVHRYVYYRHLLPAVFVNYFMKSRLCTAIILGIELIYICMGSILCLRKVYKKGQHCGMTFQHQLKVLRLSINFKKNSLKLFVKSV